MQNKLSRLIPDYYLIHDLRTHEEPEQINESELRLRADVHFDMLAEDLEKALVGEVIVTTEFRIEPGYLDTFSSDG